MRHRQPARHMPPSAAAARPSRTTAASFPLLAALLLVLATPVNTEEVKIGNVLAPRAALNFKGNTAWPYGLCEVRHLLLLPKRCLCHLYLFSFCLY